MISRSLLVAAMTLLPLTGFALPALASSSAKFDRDCEAYYRQGLDQDVDASYAAEHCACLADTIGEDRKDILDFLGRTYSDDLTTFIHEYPKGDAWMEEQFAADAYCKSDDDASDNGADEPGAEYAFPIEAGSWGGVVRAGPGQEYQRLVALREGEDITLLENTGVIFNDFPWFRISYRGGREGYHWGGIVCGKGMAIPGAFEICN